MAATPPAWLPIVANHMPAMLWRGAGREAALGFFFQTGSSQPPFSPAFCGNAIREADRTSRAKIEKWKGRTTFIGSLRLSKQPISSARDLHGGRFRALES